MEEKNEQNSAPIQIDKHESEKPLKKVENVKHIDKRRVKFNEIAKKTPSPLEIERFITEKIERLFKIGVPYHKSVSGTYTQLKKFLANEELYQRYKLVFKERVEKRKGEILKKNPELKQHWNQKQTIKKKIKKLRPLPTTEPEIPKSKEEIQETLEKPIEIATEAPEPEEESEEEYEEPDIDYTISLNHKKETLDKLKCQIQNEIDKSGFDDNISFQIQNIFEYVKEFHDYIIKIHKGNYDPSIPSDFESVSTLLKNLIEKLSEYLEEEPTQIVFLQLIERYIVELSIYKKKADFVFSQVVA